MKLVMLPHILTLLDRIVADPDSPAMGELEQLATAFMSVNMGVIG